MDLSDQKASSRSVVGLIPAAGHASRLGRLPCSKEIYPIGWDGARPKVVSHYLLEQLCAAGVDTAYVVLRKGKWDIPTYWEDGQGVGLTLAYLMMGAPYGAPFTLDQAYPFVRRSNIAMGFPDILLTAENPYGRLLDRQATSQADVVLGLCRAERPEKVDMVRLDDAGRPVEFAIKPKATSLTDTWLCAVWTPHFTLYMHELIGDVESNWNADEELFLGDVFQRALTDGLSFDAVRFPEAEYVDIGTPAELRSLDGSSDPRTVARY